jgi:hypothetical protein
MRRMKKSERQEYVMRRARELAQSGNFDRWSDIEFELRVREGFSEAREWLDTRFIRSELDGICAQARKKHPPNT